MQQKYLQCSSEDLRAKGLGDAFRKAADIFCLAIWDYFAIKQ